MAAVDAWFDFETLRQSIKQHTVDRLKQILIGLKEECGTSLYKSGKKQDLIDRIIAQLDLYRQSGNVANWTKAKAVLYLVRNTGMYNASRMPSSATVQSSSAAPHSTYAATTSSSPNGYQAGGSSVGRYDAYAPPRRPIASASMASSTGQRPGIRFHSSPFLRVDQAVSVVVECPESTSGSDRRQQTVTFTLTDDQLNKLKSTCPTYQLRLYCTSSSFYASGPNGFRTHMGSCPIEFPPTCEVRVNNVPLSANLKGLKKKPGTAPPADLGKAARMSNVNANRVEMIYVNSQQPVQTKKYYLVVNLVEVTSVGQIVEGLKRSKYSSSEAIRAKMVASRTDDDDIIAGPQKMSLKCPLSFVRIVTPCRSSLCVHAQCFDATSWFSVMEQTTTWLCPVCEKTLNFEDLIMDGYFDEILKQCPDSVEDVVVEADGEWHTSDNKYASTAWKLSHPTVVMPSSSPPRKPLSSAKTSPHVAVPRNEKEKPNDVEIFVLDSDDEDEGRVKRELSPSFGSGSSGSANQSFDRFSVPMTQSREDIIDLTLDSDSDDNQPIISGAAGKRKSAEVISPQSVQGSKRVRVDDTQGISRAMAVRTLTDRHVNGAGSSTSSLPGNAFQANGGQYASYPGACPTNHVQSPCPPAQPLGSPSLQIRFDGHNYPPPSYPSHTVAFSPAGGAQSHSPTYSSYTPRGLGDRWL